MKTTAIVTLIISIFLTGCRDNQEQPAETTPQIEHKDAVHPENVGWEDDMELDEGTQWEVDRGTTEGIQRMSQLLEEKPTNSVEEYRRLGDDLEKEQNNIDRENNANGASKRNLDIYLEPLNEKIEQLQEVDSEEEGARIKSELEEHLYAYSNYFV